VRYSGCIGHNGAFSEGANRGIMRNAIRGWMSQVRSCPDDTYWNEKATELAYLAELRNSGTATSPRLDQKTLHERAIATVGAVDFDELLLELGIDAS